MGFNCLKATATSRREFTFYHSVPRNFWYSFYRPQKDERLSRPWSHPVVLNAGPLDWQSSALTTRPLLHITKITVTFTKLSQNSVLPSVGVLGCISVNPLKCLVPSGKAICTKLSFARVYHLLINFVNYELLHN